MLYTINTAAQTLTGGASIAFATNSVLTGAVATHTAGAAEVSLNKPGFYVVHFNGDCANAGSTSGNVTARLLANGVAVAGAEATATSASTTDVVNVSFEALVQVAPNRQCNCANVPLVLTVQNGGVGATYTNAALVVSKLC